MKLKWLLSILCFVFFTINAAPGGVPTEKYNILEKSYNFSSEYEITSKTGAFLSKISKSRFTHFPDIIRTHYDLTNENGEMEAYGISSFFSSGTWHSWKTNIEIYDSANNTIGFIQGDSVSADGANFTIYDKAFQVVGVASVDSEKPGFKIILPNQNGNRPIVSLHPVYLNNKIDSWDYKIFVQLYDHRLIKIFLTFAIDHQSYLIK